MNGHQNLCVLSRSTNQAQNCKKVERESFHEHPSTIRGHPKASKLHLHLNILLIPIHADDLFFVPGQAHADTAYKPIPDPALRTFAYP